MRSPSLLSAPFFGLLFGLCAICAHAAPKAEHTPTPNTQSTDAEDHCTGSPRQYSVLRPADNDCGTQPVESLPIRSATTTPRASNDEFLDEDWLKTEMLGFTVIGVAQIRGGTELLRNLWYAGSIVVPTFMPRDPDYGMKPNYLAITPAFVALGVLNDYLHRDDADNARIFLSNFVGFNLALLWSHNVLGSPEKFFHTATTGARQISTQWIATANGAHFKLDMRW